MAEETEQSTFELSEDRETAYNESLVILNDYPGKNPHRQITKFEFYFLAEISRYILLLTTIAAGIH